MMRWEYATKSKITNVGDNNSTYIDPAGIVVDSIELKPKRFDKRISVGPNDEPNMEYLKDVLRGDIFTDDKYDYLLKQWLYAAEDLQKLGGDHLHCQIFEIYYYLHQPRVYFLSLQ